MDRSDFIRVETLRRIGPLVLAYRWVQIVLKGVLQNSDILHMVVIPCMDRHFDLSNRAQDQVKHLGLA